MPRPILRVLSRTRGGTWLENEALPRIYMAADGPHNFAGETPRKLSKGNLVEGDLGRPPQRAPGKPTEGGPVADQRVLLTSTATLGQGTETACARSCDLEPA